MGKVRFYIAFDNPTERARMLAVLNGDVIRSASYSIDLFNPISTRHYRSFIARFKPCMQWPKFNEITHKQAINYNAYFDAIGLEKEVHSDNIVIPTVYRQKLTRSFGQVLKRKAFYDFKSYCEFRELEINRDPFLKQ